MNLEDLIKLAGVSKSVEPVEVQTDAPVQEQPLNPRDDMKTLIALVTPEQLNKLTGEAVAEEMPGEATTKPNPEEYKGTLGSPADLSLRRYLGANGMPVSVDETKVYEDHKVEDLSEAYAEYKAKNDTVKEYYVDPVTRQVFTSKADAKDGIGGNAKKYAPSPGGDQHPPMVTKPKYAPSPGGDQHPPIVVTPKTKPKYAPSPGGDQHPPIVVTPPTSPGEAPPVMPGKGGGQGGEAGGAPPNIPDIDYIKPGSPKMPDYYPKRPGPKRPDIPHEAPPGMFDEPFIPKDKNGDGKIDYRDFFDLEREREMPTWLTRIMANAGIKGKNESTKPLEEEPNEGNEFSGALAQAKKDGKKEFKVGDKTYKVESEETSRLRHLAGTQQVDEAPFPGEYDDGGAVTGVVGKQDVDLRFAKWSKDTPSELMAVINKLNLTPDEAWQMGARDNMADVDIVVDYHDKFTDRFDDSGMSDDERTDAIDIDGGTAWMDSPEHDALFDEVINPLCQAMGMEGGNIEECGQALMKYIDDTPPQESVNEGGMKQAEIEVQDWANKYNEYLGVNGDELANGYLQAMMNTGIMSDAFDQDEYIAFNEKNGYDDDGDWSEDDHDKFMQSSPITRGMFREIRAIEKKYGIDEKGVNDIMGYFESVNRMKTLAGV